jgi:Phosphate transport (Pho88)
MIVAPKVNVVILLQYHRTHISHSPHFLFAVSVALLGIHYLAYLQLGTNKKSEIKIWVPPKAKPVLPFGLGPPEEVVTPEQYVETTYEEHETKLLKDSAQQILLSVGIALLMSFKFNVHVSLVIQSVTSPVGLIDSVILKKYLLGYKDANAYGEFFKKPTTTELAALKSKKDAEKESKSLENIFGKVEKEAEKVEKEVKTVSTGTKCAAVEPEKVINAKKTSVESSINDIN